MHPIRYILLTKWITLHDEDDDTDRNLIVILCFLPHPVADKTTHIEVCPVQDITAVDVQDFSGILGIVIEYLSHQDIRVSASSISGFSIIIPPSYVYLQMHM